MVYDVINDTPTFVELKELKVCIICENNGMSKEKLMKAYPADAAHKIPSL